MPTSAATGPACAPTRFNNSGDIARSARCHWQVVPIKGWIHSMGFQRMQRRAVRAMQVTRPQDIGDAVETRSAPR
jgi:hypothetical protein